METIKNQRGQLLIFIALSFVVLGMFVGLAVDGGVGYLTHSRLQRTVDAAALAGASRLLLGDGEAERAACDMVAVNAGGTDCGTGERKFSVRIADLEEYGKVLPAVFVTGHATIRTSFMRVGKLFGCDRCDALAVSALGVAVPPPELDILLVLDDTSSMREGCDFEQSNSCPAQREREGAAAFAKFFLTALTTARIGLLPFRGCYNADGSGRCVGAPEIMPLSGDLRALTGLRGTRGPEVESPDTGTGIAGLWAQGGSGTNICKALEEAGRRIGDAATGRKRAVVLLTDADNHPETGVEWDCAASGDGMDGKTRAAADALRRSGVEIFVLGYGIDGDSDRRLARDIASERRNFFEALDKDDIPEQFEAVAREMLRRVRLAV